MKRIRPALLFLLAIILFFCPASAIADKPMTLRIHCWEGYAKPYVSGFKEIISHKYGEDIDIKISNASDPSEFWELSRGMKVDIISPAHNIPKNRRWSFIDGGVALPVNLANIPNYKNLLDLLKNNDFVTKNGLIYGVPYTIGPYGLAYNADKVGDPGSWSVLFDSGARGKYTISKDYPDCNIYVSALILGATYSDIYDADKLLKKVRRPELQANLNTLASNAVSLWEGTANPDEFKNLYYTATWGYAVAQANLKGGNWKMAQPKEGTTMWADHWLITYAVKNDPFKKQLCEEWVNYCLSPEIQVGVIRNWGVSPVVTNIMDKITPEEAKTFRVGDNEYWKTLSFWQNQNARTTNFYKRFWEKAMLFSN